MSLLNVPTPMIPVLDECLVCPAGGNQVHRSKIDNYNDLLESIYHRELELLNLKASMLDMRHEIVEEADTFDTRGTLILPSGPATELGTSNDTSSDPTGTSDNDAASLSEGSDSSNEKPSLKAIKKRKGSKGKGKGRERSARISGEELGANWDYEVNPSKRQPRARRASDASAESDDEDL